MSFFQNMGNKSSSEHLNTIIGDGTVLSGDIAISGGVRIEGRFSGKLSAAGNLTIGQNGVLASNDTIHCQSAHIAGSVQGDLIAPQKVHLTHTARFNGSITTQILVIEEGAKFNGSSRMGSDTEEPKQMDKFDPGIDEQLYAGQE